MEFKEEIAQILEKQTKLKKEDIISSLEVPPNPALGDFAFPCFRLAGVFKKNPAEIAKQLEKEIKPSKSIIQVKAQGPYLNFFVDKNIIIQDLFDNINEDYGKSKEGRDKKIVIDFSAPNIGKPMHAGHIRTTIIGDSLMRTFNFLGYKPIGINYLGDIGLHIGKLIVAWELWLDKRALEKDPIAELLRLYVKFCQNEKSEVQEGQEEADDEKDYSNNEWTKKAKEKLKLIELGDKRAHEIWEEIRKASGKGFDRVYKTLQVNFNETTGQSKFSEAGKEIIINAQKKGLVKLDETGALYVDFKYEKFPKKFVLRSNGTASYMTQDIGAAVERYKKYKFDEMIYVTDYRQSLHFQQLFEILNLFGFDFSKKCKHLGFGTVNFGKEIFATREGRVILLEDVLKKTIDKAKEEIDKRKTKGDPEKIGVGAIKYIILRNEPIKNVEFSWDAALNFEGDSGPYLQYSYARASSIIKKANKNKKQTKNKLVIPDKLEIQEIALIKKIQDFPSIARQVADKLNPQLLANYSFQLSQAFSDFYTNCKVIGTEQEQFRLKLMDAFRITLKNALYLLGIEVMEQM
jgi:arginyl-tRNA synthetase